MNKYLSISIVLIACSALVFMVMFGRATQPKPSPTLVINPKNITVLLLPAELKNVEAINLGKLYYLNNCEYCHGLNGEGTRRAQPIHQLTPEKINFDFIYTTVREGRSGTTMKAWKDSLQDNDIKKISAYILYINTINKLEIR